MDTITNLIKDVPIPKMVKVRQKFDDSHITAEEIPGVVMRELDREELGGKIKPGQRIAKVSDLLLGKFRICFHAG